MSPNNATMLLGDQLILLSTSIEMMNHTARSLGRRSIEGSFASGVFEVVFLINHFLREGSVHRRSIDPAET